MKYIGFVTIERKMIAISIVEKYIIIAEYLEVHLIHNLTPMTLKLVYENNKQFHHNVPSIFSFLSLSNASNSNNFILESSFAVFSSSTCI